MRRPAQPAPEIPGLIGAPDVIPAHTIGATVASTLLADGDGFETRPVASLTVDFDGVAGDRHRGATRFAGAREPWFRRGAAMRNERQITIVDSDELADIAVALALPEFAPSGSEPILFSGTHRAFRGFLPAREFSSTAARFWRSRDRMRPAWPPERRLAVIILNEQTSRSRFQRLRGACEG